MQHAKLNPGVQVYILSLTGHQYMYTWELSVECKHAWNIVHHIIEQNGMKFCSAAVESAVHTDTMSHPPL